VLKRHSRTLGQATLISLDEQQALAGEHEEVLLGVLAVIHAVRLARLQHLDVDAEVGEADVALADARGAERLVMPPRRLERVDDEPALTRRNEPTLGLPERSLADNAYRTSCVRVPGNRGSPAQSVSPVEVPRARPEARV
jgi:hypothetical protein